MVLAAVWLACALYTLAYLRIGWIPLDSGMLAQEALRALRGQLPHRDFGEFYTGGLTYLDALAFRLFGVNLVSLRIPLYLFFLAWVPSVYFIARRFVRPLAAGAVTLLAVAWSVPNHVEAVPSWYNLFFATWGILALLRYIESDKKCPDGFIKTGQSPATAGSRPDQRWLWVAGLCGGLSFLAKSTGLYFVVAGLLFLIFREQSLSGRAPDGRPQESPLHGTTEGSGAPPPQPPPRAPKEAVGAGLVPARSPSRHAGLSYRLFVTLGLLLFLAALTGLISERPTVGDYFQFLLPLGSMVAVLLWQTWTWPSAERSGARFRKFFAMLLPLLAAVFVPIVLFGAWFAAHHALGAWIGGVFIRPALRPAWAAYGASGPGFIVGLLPAGLVLLLGWNPQRRLPPWIVPLFLVCMLAVAWKGPAAFAFFGISLPFLVPIVALAAAFSLRRPLSPAPVGAGLAPARPGTADHSRRQMTFLLVSAAAACALIQFPFSVPTYFEFIAPLVILALVALLAGGERGGRFDPVALGSLLTFYLAFAVFLHTPGYYAEVGGPPPKPIQLETLGIPRAGAIRAPARLAREYRETIALVRAHARGEYIYATPDLPVVYFLSGLSNPTQTISDLLDPDFFDPAARDRRILSSLRNRNVNVVVLGPGNNSLAGDIPPGLRALLDARYPESATVGNFEVRWKP